MKRVESHIFQGMQRDVSISKQQPQFLWDAVNIRLTAREGDTLMSVTNEKGSVESGIYCTGSYMGHCVIGNNLVVFTTDDGYDYIYRITKMEEGFFKKKKLYGGSIGQPSLGFDPSYPLQTLGVYENEHIQKVYWTDGINQPRVINIVKDLLNSAATEYYNEKSFDFVPEMQLDDSIHVKKLSDSSGSFPSGVIQYAVTYYNKYGQQSNISCVSPLIPISFFGRAGSPEEKVSNSFRIVINNPDTTFEYLRLYSIFRSSLNGTPICRRVEDVKLGDGGTSGTYYKIETSGTIISNYFWVTGAYQATESNGDPFNQSGFVYTEHVPYVNNGSFFHIQKDSSTEHLVIKIKQQNNTYKYITWGGATEIFISKNSLAGGAGTAYYVVGADGWNETGNFRNVANLFVSTGEIQYVEKRTVENVTITDNGSIGETIDPQELFYIGGDEIVAETIESKDGTLFFGNIVLKQAQIESLKSSIETGVTITTNNTRQVSRAIALNSNNYKWGSSLNSTGADDYATNPAGFKYGEHYRLGVQFQYKNGKWSEPVYIPNMSGNTDIGSYTCNENPEYNESSSSSSSEVYNIPCFKGVLSSDIRIALQSKGYKRVRGVVVFPTTSDRLILAQGILNPTVSCVTAHDQHSPDYQSSWFFRPWISSSFNNDSNILEGAVVEWEHNTKLFGFNDRGAEIQGLPVNYTNWSMMGNTINFGGGSFSPVYFDNVNIGNKNNPKYVTVRQDLADSVFYVDQQYVTMHSPEFEFEDSLKNLDFIETSLRKRGYVQFNANVGDIFIETSTPPIGKSSTGFVRKVMNWGGTGACRRLCAGLFYNDWLVDENVNDNKNLYAEFPHQGYEVGFMVYPWNKSGSLNNDCNRPAEAGVRSAVLKRKIISNMLYSRQTSFVSSSDIPMPSTSTPKLFDLDQIGLVKLGGNTNYYGNIDTLLGAMAPFGSIISTGENIWKINKSDYNDMKEYGSGQYKPTEDYMSYSTHIFNSRKNYFWKGVEKGFEHIARDENQLVWTYKMGIEENTIGKENESLTISKASIRMKYKSTPHAVMYLTSPLTSSNANSLYLAELYRSGNSSTDFGGTSPDAIQANMWVPAGEAVSLNDTDNSGRVPFYYEWGDTWYQRYDCLKTYPFTPEDENQIVEIGSFMVETHVNIDGRYDRNRGQDSNLYVNPQNFNLINPVYSQLDNFFSYKIMDADFYKLNAFPATVAWTLQKNNASEIDAWTNITLSNTLDMDGTMGPVTSINSSNDTLYCFQERGVSQIMFNSRVQIPASDGVPIEISNSYKVDGSRGISSTVGCYNKFSITKSPIGLYFIDGVGSTLYLLQGNQMQNISDTHGMGYWFSQQDTQRRWIPSGGEGGVDRRAQGMRVCYDNVNNDLYMIPYNGKALCYSEQLQQFVSFFDYYPYAIFNLGNSVHAIGDDENTVGMWNLFEGEYNKLMGTFFPSSITFVSNADMQMDKIFTNLETRADFYMNGELQHMHFFDTIRVWNEYQDTDWLDESFMEEHTTQLEHKYYPYSSSSISSNVKKKFRIWRIDIPRAKKWVAYTQTEKQAMINSGQYTSNTVPGGHLININDRIRNTWCKIKLTMNIPPTNSEELENFHSHNMEMHDISVIYYV